MNQLQVYFVLERTTKGAVRYQECTQDGSIQEINGGAKIGTLYVRKDALSNGEIPERLLVTVEEA